MLSHRPQGFEQAILRFPHKRLSERPLVARFCFDFVLCSFSYLFVFVFQVDVELAKIQAQKPPEDDEVLRKKLWLRIARHVVEEEGDVKK